ncbi:diacylglycerol/lipid kinase family protein [Roseibium denhamense]|uniref:diacylglycerol/lipid kinase family protein n=1 Tax=Roseibium denhamense TaxID=76305 RepID=UPI001AD91501|nr:YegS/Rv2252/BmrU family lipid kinase [Roseibium denhamense]
MKVSLWSVPEEPVLESARAVEGSVLIMANPTSGGFSARFLEDVRTRLGAAGCTAEIRLTRHAGEIGELCSDPEFRVKTLVIAGGDGSINEALTGLQDHPEPPRLAVIPFGTANVLALELGLPRNAQKIADMIVGEVTRPLHFGLANGRPFVLMVSSGFDAEVVHGVPLALKRKLKKLAYVITAVRLAFKRDTTDLDVAIDGKVHHAKMAVASNARHYGGPFVICPGGATEAGLHMVILEKDDPFSAFLYGLALLSGRIERARGARVIPFQQATITSLRPAAAQVDGDPFGATPLTITAADTAIPILVPAS